MPREASKESADGKPSKPRRSSRLNRSTQENKSAAETPEIKLRENVRTRHVDYRESSDSDDSSDQQNPIIKRGRGKPRKQNSSNENKNETQLNAVTPNSSGPTAAAPRGSTGVNFGSSMVDYKEPSDSDESYGQQQSIMKRRRGRPRKQNPFSENNNRAQVNPVSLNSSGPAALCDSTDVDLGNSTVSQIQPSRDVPDAVVEQESNNQEDSDSSYDSYVDNDLRRWP